MSTPRPKSVVYRVTGLPRLPESEVDAFLRKAIENELLEIEELEEEALAVMMKNLKSISVILPPKDSSVEDSHVLLEWKPGNFPNFLSFLNENPSNSHEIEFENRDISFDRHFLGFTQLYTTELDEPITADIIALSGLDGHAYGSFRGKGNLGKMWLRDFLSRDMKSCRTMIYGYNSKLSSHGIDTIMDYGRGFLEEIKKVRKTKEELRRPLFFIAHSFGGIIVAHAICKASMINDHDDQKIASMYKATYGVLFFGTPHKGMAVANIRSMLLEDNPRQELLDTIDEKSLALISQLSDFKNVIRGRKIVSFVETSQTRNLVSEPESTAGMARTGDFATSVETDFALLGLADSDETKIPLNLDQSQLVKYDNDKAIGYTSALHYLAEFEKDAGAVVRARFLGRHTAFTPSSNVPYPRDPDFVGRREVLETLKRRLSSFDSHKRVALVGLGGMGKSQIAIEFSYILRERSEETWVFWVYATSAARLEQSYREIAERLELDERNNPDIDIMQLVTRWLSDERNGRWLLIIDNADDARMFSPPHMQSAVPDMDGNSKAGTTKNLLAYIPSSTTGAVLVTSRNKDAGHRIVGTHANDLINVISMTERESLDLLNAKLPHERSLDVSQEILLLEELHHIPLAIAQAAAYITKGSPRMTVSKYLDIFKENDNNRSNLLDQDAGDLRRDSEVPNAVITTWQISFTQIRHENPSAAGLLSLMSVLHRQGIPESLLLIQMSDRLAFEAAIALLIGFSLITANLDGPSFEMHRLVQLATKKWLTVQDEIFRWSQTALQMLSVQFPVGNYEDHKLCEKLLPHVEMVLSYNFETEVNLLLKAHTLHKMSNYLLQSGKLGLSKVKIKQALEIKERYLHREDKNFLHTLGLYGRVLSKNGEYDVALPICQEDLALKEKVLGKEHLDTIQAMNTYAQLLHRRGKYGEAEPIYRQVLTSKKEILGKEDRETLTSMNNLALLLQNQGKYNEAEEMLRQVVGLRGKILGKEHPDTLNIKNNLALLLQLQGKYNDAELIYRETLFLREKVLRKEHPDTLRRMSNLAVCLGFQGKHEEAEAMHRQTLKLKKEVLGMNHPDTLVSMNDLAIVLEKQGKYQEAEAMHRQTLNLQKEVLGMNHPDTLMSMSNLAVVLRKQGKYQEAEAMHRQTLKLRKEVLGMNHPVTLISMNSLAVVLEKQGKYQEAEAMHRQTLKLRKEVLGMNHPHTLLSMMNLAVVLAKQGKYQEAEAMHRQTLKLRKEVLGMNHPDTLMSLSNLAVVLGKQGKYQEAEAMHRQTLKLRKEVLGMNHPETLISMNNLGLVLSQQGRHQEAEAMHRQTLKLHKEVLGMNHPGTLMSMNNLAASLYYQGQLQEAKEMFQQTVDLRKEVLGANHPDTLQSIKRLATVTRKLKEAQEGESESSNDEKITTEAAQVSDHANEDVEQKENPVDLALR